MRFALPSQPTKTLAASAARTTTLTTGWFESHEAQGLLLSFVVSAVTSTPGFTPKMQYSPDGGTTAIDYVAFTAIASITATNYSFLIDPRILASADGAMTESVALPVPRLFRLVNTVANANSATYAIYGMYL